MIFFHYLRRRRWPTVFGYLLFVGMMAVGYYYNVTFVQLGLIDLGERLVGLGQARVAQSMAVLALVACIVALATGALLQRRPDLRRLRMRLQITFFVILVQTLLTLITPLVRTEAAFTLWILAASVTLGVGMPVTFSLTVDLIPSRDRGYVAAIITAIAYFAAAAAPSNWHIEDFRAPLLLLMVPAVPVLGWLALGRPRNPRLALVDALSRQHQHPAFAYGRFVQYGDRVSRGDRSLIGLLVLMFGIYFVDSLGFLRIIATPSYVDAAWRSPDLAPHLFIAVVHVVSALVAGVLYTSLSRRHLFFWVLGIFALVHLMYTFPFSFGNGGQLAMPMLYAIAVSLYTVLNFALWADLSTPDTIGRNAALGVALSAWTATFISTALATQWRLSGMLAARHLRWVDAVALLFFIALLILPFLPRRGPLRSTVRTDAFGNPPAQKQPYGDNL